jgi:hypothetical protein
LLCPLVLVTDLDDADLVLTVRAREGGLPRALQEAQLRGRRVAVVRNDTVKQLAANRSVTW